MTTTDRTLASIRESQPRAAVPEDPAATRDSTPGRTEVARSSEKKDEVCFLTSNHMERMRPVDNALPRLGQVVADPVREVYLPTTVHGIWVTETLFLHV